MHLTLLHRESIKSLGNYQEVSSVHPSMVLKTTVDSCSRILQAFPTEVKRPELEVNHSYFPSAEAKKKWRHRVQFLICLIMQTETNLVVRCTWVVKTVSLQIVITFSFTDVSTKNAT